MKEKKLYKIYSHSKLKTFDQCKYRYKLRYIDRVPPEIGKSIEAHLGTVVHNALEWLYKEVKKGRTPELDELIIYYSENWQKEIEEHKKEIVIIKKGLEIKDYFEKGIGYLINYYTKHKPFKDKTVEVEKKIVVDLTDTHKLQGYIDRLVYNEETDEYEIHDYKTSNSAPTQDSIENDTQLALYSIGIKENLDYNKEIKLVWHYLSFNQKVESRRTEENLKKLKEDTIKKIEEIESTAEFPPSKSILCNWCEYKNICPVGKKVCY